jgi:general secretion pathway protein E
MTVAAEVITDQVLLDARTLANETDSTLLEALHQITGLSPDELIHALGKALGYQVLDMGALQVFEPGFEAIAFAEAVQRGIVAGIDSKGVTTLVLSDPFDTSTESWAMRRLVQVGGIEPAVALARADDLQAFFSRLENGMRAMDGLETKAMVGNDEEVAAVISLSSISDDASPVVKLVNSTIYDALKMQASDIHLECDAGCLHVQYRIDGVLVPITLVQGQDLAEQVISRIKVMAELDIAERRVPQDGRFKVRINGRDVDFRVSVMPNIFGEDAVLRLLDRQSLTEEARTLCLDHLGLDPRSMSIIRKLAGKPHGMLLVTGPTGSGKTTTLYAAITEIHNGRDKIVTIEDPVEYRLPRVLQIPVNEKKGLTFARGLRSILRHDPDKIMVGEIRDDETAQIAVQAALTGHLVFTTVHANSVFDVLGRFLHMGVDSYSFASALNGIVAQRLVRMNCPHCAVSVVPDRDELYDLDLSDDLVADWKFMAGSGCGHCRGTGYKGRRAAAEVLVLNDHLREMVASRAPVSQLKEHAARSGLQSLQQVALGWVAQGETTLSEVLRVAG